MTAQRYIQRHDGRFRRFAVLLLVIVLMGLFYIPCLTYSVWRHQHRMHFKEEAAKMYHQRPELFATFVCDDSFFNEIEMLKPGKEFRRSEKKYDIIDTLYQEGQKVWVCIQDEYEMALEMLIKDRSNQEEEQNTGTSGSDWIKTFKSPPAVLYGRNTPFSAASETAFPFWSNHYQSPFTQRDYQPPQGRTIAHF